MYVTLVHSWDCATTPVNLYWTGAVPVANRIAWSENLIQHVDEQWGKAHKGTDACGNQPDMPMEFSGGLTSLLASAATQNWGAVTLGLSTLCLPRKASVQVACPSTSGPDPWSDRGRRPYPSSSTITR
jgi:hypothetical protein